FLSGTMGSTRSTACWRKERLPKRVSNCFGVFCRLTGQNRSPLPPAIMMTKRLLRSDLFFFMISNHCHGDFLTKYAEPAEFLPFRRRKWLGRFSNKYSLHTGIQS